jgi:hypothetical protein
LAMQFPSVPASNKEGRSPDLGDLCEAMFIEGSRTLGFDFTDEIPPAAQRQIMKAAARLAERLGNMISIQASAGNSSEFGN